MNKPIKTQQQEQYFTNGSESKFDYYSEAAIVSSTGTGSRTFIDFDSNISVKSDFGRADYNYFRSANTSNLTMDELFRICDKAYEKVSIVRNIMDTISEFACQGVDVVHRETSKNKFIKEWFRRVRGQFVSERFCSMAERHANIPIQIAYAKINVPVENEMTRTMAGFDNEMVKKDEVVKKEIPWRFTFLHPCSIEVIGGNAAVFIDKPAYALKLDKSLKSELAKLNKLGATEKQAELEAEINKAISNAKGNLLPLNPSRFEMYHYKKDDWQIWAVPIIKSILDNLIHLEKLQLADSAALDGAISNIRHWKVGIIDPTNPAASIIPTKAGINKMKQIIANNVGGGTMDLVTGPELSFTESNTKVYQFLNPDKFKNTLDAIYDGLGVPPVLRSGGTGGTSSNNYVSIKTLIERLRYIRSMLVEFWTKQLIIIQKALGWKYPANIVFDEIILSDESLEKKLLLDLCDREIISEDAVREYFGYIPEIERIRLTKQMKSRDANKIPPKASPFHNPQTEQEMQKLSLQSGDVTPSQVGVKLKPKKAGEKTRTELMDQQKVLQIKENTKVKMKLAAGRPKNVKETKKRKPKPAKTRSKADQILLWAQSSYSKIADILLPALLASYSKKNVRQLTEAQFQEVEDIKFNILSNIEPFSEITEANIIAILNIDNSVDNNITSAFNKLFQDFIKSNGREPTIDERRFIQVVAYSKVKSEVYL